ncbi:methyltransferase [Leptospira jelokensis]|uniref:Methyltransferase n=2 Tax=Leptospira jelokensis TaxID=2484931 RepID=A0A4Z1A7N3_9LEPT|nr:methyltransferase [Leptospira jelokensis]
MKNQFLAKGGKGGVGKPMTDFQFDSLLPEALQILSPYQWTPNLVIAHTWEFLKGEKVSSLLDLGSGVGKFCLILSQYAKNRFPICGMEDRNELVQIAESLKIKMNVGNVSFVSSNFLESFPYGHSHYYVFNPLYETIKGSHTIGDAKIKSAKLFLHNLQRLKEHLFFCPKGTKLITYHGFGGSVLPGYKVQTKVNLELGEWMVWEKE